MWLLRLDDLLHWRQDHSYDDDKVAQLGIDILVYPFDEFAEIQLLHTDLSEPYRQFGARL